MNEGVTGGRQITAYLDTTNKPPPTSSTRRWHARVYCSVAVNPLGVDVQRDELIIGGSSHDMNLKSSSLHYFPFEKAFLHLFRIPSERKQNRRCLYFD